MYKHREPDYLPGHAPSPLAGMLMMLFFGFTIGVVSTALYLSLFVVPR